MQSKGNHLPLASHWRNLLAERLGLLCFLLLQIIFTGLGLTGALVKARGLIRRKARDLGQLYMYVLDRINKIINNNYNDLSFTRHNESLENNFQHLQVLNFHRK